jgi:hypothetical protein
LKVEKQCNNHFELLFWLLKIEDAILFVHVILLFSRCINSLLSKQKCDNAYNLSLFLWLFASSLSIFHNLGRYLHILKSQSWIVQSNFPINMQHATFDMSFATTF